MAKRGPGPKLVASWKNAPNTGRVGNERGKGKWQPSLGERGLKMLAKHETSKQTKRGDFQGGGAQKGGEKPCNFSRGRSGRSVICRADEKKAPKDPNTRGARQHEYLLLRQTGPGNQKK